MNCLQSISRSWNLRVCRPGAHFETPPKFNLVAMRTNTRSKVAMSASSGIASSAEKSSSEEDNDKSETYSHDMTQAMGAVLTYRHELGMNYNFIRPDLIVGSCLQTPEDVDKLRKIGVKTIFCLQQDPDLEYFGVDIVEIQEYAKQCEDIEHYRAEIRDFDAFDLRMRLPAVVSTLFKAIKRNGGVTYIHCTAGLGRAPAVALAYMFWVLGYKLGDAHELLLSQRSCFPKLEAIKNATADILTGIPTDDITLTWEDEENLSVEVSGLDIGWGERIPLEFDGQRGIWTLKKTLPAGRYEYKYVVDGEWKCSEEDLLTDPNGDGHVNNYVQVNGEGQSKEDIEVRERLTNPGADAHLTEDERSKILQFLETCTE